MNSSITAYLQKRADLESRPLVTASTADIDTVVVIPALAERELLPETLKSIAGNEVGRLRCTLVICVVNNRVACDETIRSENRDTIDFLNRTLGGESPFASLRLAYVDASSAGHELPEKEGVGLARKIGMDWGLKTLHQSKCVNPVLLSLDADTTVDGDYLKAVREHFDDETAWAAVIRYAHPFEGSDIQQASIVCYELFLRYHVLGLRYAESPYAFHTIGSSMACSPEAYAAVSGMKRRQGGEDFYFLQELAKTGRVDWIRSTTVCPSPRPSWRVPFGTGPRVRRFMEGKTDEYTLYHPEVYSILRRWLELVAKSLSFPGEHVLEQSAEIYVDLASFLSGQRFVDTWKRIQDNAPHPQAHLAQFHRWFDGLKTLKCIHHLRDHGYADGNMFDSILRLLDRIESPYAPSGQGRLQNNLGLQKKLLQHLREIT